MSNSKYDYRVIEDNGGGIHLFLFTPGTEEIVMGFDWSEYSPGSLLHGLAFIEEGDDCRGWEGKKPNPAEDWAYITGHDFGYALVAYYEDGQRTTHPERMGRAAQIRFKIEPD